MKKISVASIPTFLDPGLKEDSENTVVLKGQTAKLHSRSGGFQDERQGTRQRKESLMPPIPSARSSPSFRKTSTPRRPDGLRPNTPVDQEDDQTANSGIMVVGETGYLPLESRKKSSAEKLSDTGFHLYTLEDSNKLPKILKPKKKVSKGAKRKKIISTNDQNNNSIVESKEDDMEPRLKAIERGNQGTSEEEGELHNKYGLDLKKDFNIEVTRPYTFSYFPEIIKKKKKDGNSEAEKRKSRKISKVDIKTSFS